VFGCIIATSKEVTRIDKIQVVEGEQLLLENGIAAPEAECVQTLQGDETPMSPIYFKETPESTSGHKKGRQGILRAVDVTREKHLTPRCKNFYKIVGDWSRRTAKLQRSVGSLRKRLKYAEKFANGPNFQNIVDCVNEPTYTFIMQQARLQKVRPRARRFKLDEKILSLALYKNSPKGYRLLSKIFSLPSPRTLTNMLNKIPYRPGINKQILNSLKTRVQDLKENEKICAVVFDEISIAPLLQYNSKEDYIEGVQD
jgi:hypothetical protein